MRSVGETPGNLRPVMGDTIAYAALVGAVMEDGKEEVDVEACQPCKGQ